MRPIDADALKERILQERNKIPLTVPAAPYELVPERVNQHGNAMRGGIRVALRCMEQTPTINFVDVVRCRDCEYNEGIPMPIGFLYCSRTDSVVKEDDYCSYGERRESNGQNPTD